MGRQSQAEKDLIRTTAEEALKLLPKMREDRADLERRISRLESFVQAWNELNNGRRPKDQQEVASTGTAPTPTSRAKKGQVLGQIEAVLQDGKELDATEIRIAIEAKFAVKYGRSTIYNSLALGEKKNKLIANGKKWKVNPLMMVPKAV